MKNYEGQRSLPNGQDLMVWLLVNHEFSSSSQNFVSDTLLTQLEQGLSEYVDQRRVFGKNYTIVVTAGTFAKCFNVGDRFTLFQQMVEHQFCQSNLISKKFL